MNKNYYYFTVKFLQGNVTTYVYFYFTFFFHYFY